jgi:autotransporter family porin
MAILLVTVIAGFIAIAQYSGVGNVLGTGSHKVAAVAAIRTSASGASRARTTSQRAGSDAASAVQAASPSASTTSPSPVSSSPPPPAPTPSSSPTPSPSPSPPPASQAPAHFRTLPPGSKLPSGKQCAKWVRARPKPENKGVNRRFNQRTGQALGSNFLSGDEPAADAKIVPRVNGNFTGTTKEILRWAACKWGINQNIVFAQAAVESWWRQNTQGDFGTDASACPPNHRNLNAQGECAQSYGILQNRYPYETSAWPAAGNSTAMNADTAYAIWRSCYDGYETWLNTVDRGSQYQKGDVWGCVGRWFAGRWRTAPALQYIAKVKQYRSERIWETPDFQQP